MRIWPVGDGAFSVEFGDRIDPAANAKVMALCAAVLDGGHIPGLVEVVPSFRSVLVVVDPLLYPMVEDRVRALAQDLPEVPRAEGRLWEIPTVYDGPDLDAVAAATGMGRDAVIALHSGQIYGVAMLGFMPGFAYMTGVAEALRLPRRAEPRVRVPAGSVAMADEMTAIYPWDSPGGWHLLGRTGMTLFNLDNTPPALLAPGDRVRFVPVTS